MGKSVTPPPSPNFQQSAADQAAANKEAALWSAQTSNPNVINPLYAQKVTWQGNIPTVTQGFNPATQAGRQAAEAQAYQYTANNLLNQLAANRTAAVGQLLNQPFNLQGYGQKPIPVPQQMANPGFQTRPMTQMPQPQYSSMPQPQYGQMPPQMLRQGMGQYTSPTVYGNPMPQQPGTKSAGYGSPSVPPPTPNTDVRRR